MATKKDRINALARLFYKMQGYNVPEGHRFDEARHPQERGLYEMARVSEVYWGMLNPKPAKKPRAKKVKTET